MDHGGKITTVVENHVQGLATSKSSDGLFNAPLVFLLGFTLPSEHRDTGSGDAAVGRQFTYKTKHAMRRKSNHSRSGSVVLGGEDVLWRASSIRYELIIPESV